MPKVSPDHMEARRRLAAVLLRDKQVDEAIGELHLASTRAEDPDEEVDFIIRLSDILLNRKLDFEKALAWEMIDDPDGAHYDREAYTELLLRAIESVVAPVGVDRRTVDTWLLARAGYWGPPGALPPPGADAGAPLMHGAGLRPETNAWYNRQPDFSYAAQFLAIESVSSA